VVDAGETTVGSSVGSHSRTQRPSEVLGRRCRARVGVADVGWEQRSHLFGHKPVTSRSHSLLAQPCHRRNWFLHRTGQSTPTPMPLASFPTCGPPTTPSGAGPPPLLPPLCTSGVNISRSPETPTGRLTAVLCVARPRRDLEGETEGPVARCRSFWFCWWIFARVPEVELCVCSVPKLIAFRSVEPFSF
jgi:hypothetical protein